ncbi:uncharacterized protein [Haliotis cracherodii]|uniref:uncharacterized protein n=1 Tax=Haliotis cracherodii TaxID=6455 RepID=UPI0039E88206
MNVYSGVPLEPFLPTHHLVVDASTVVLGELLESHQTSGRWSATESTLHISNLEFKTANLEISHWAKLLRSSQLMIQSDNASVVWYFNKMGSTQSASLLALMMDFFQMIDALIINARARHIPRSNQSHSRLPVSSGSNILDRMALHPKTFKICHLYDSPEVDLFATRFNTTPPRFISLIPIV